MDAHMLAGCANDGLGASVRPACSRYAPAWLPLASLWGAAATPCGSDSALLCGRGHSQSPSTIRAHSLRIGPRAQRVSPAQRPALSLMLVVAGAIAWGDVLKL